MKKSQIISSVEPRKFAGYTINDKTTEKTLEKMGIRYDKPVMDEFIRAYTAKAVGMDILPNMVSAPNVITPLQFLQYFLPNTVYAITKAQKIEELINTQIVGSWEDEEIVTKMAERLGRPRLYGDSADIPEASFNAEYEPRTVVRLELGMSTTLLAAKRASRNQINESEEKRAAIAEAFAIEMNDIGFYGYNGGNNRTYGFLNDPNLPAYQTVTPESGTTYLWRDKSFEAKCNDFVVAFSELRTKTGERIDPRSTQITVAISSSVREYLTSPNSYGYTVEKWLTENYSNATIESAPELDGANGGSNVMIVYARALGTTNVFDLNHVARMFLLGIEQRAKGTLEDYGCATAGTILNAPLGVVRYSGI